MKSPDMGNRFCTSKSGAKMLVPIGDGTDTGAHLCGGQRIKGQNRGNSRINGDGYSVHDPLMCAGIRDQCEHGLALDLRNSSSLTKKNNLSFLIGPPRLAPN